MLLTFFFFLIDLSMEEPVMSIFKTQSKTELQDVSESFGDELHSAPTRAPLPADMPAPARDKRQKSIVQSDLHITGNIQTTGILEFAGHIDGDVSSDTLIISHEGTITGQVSAKHLTSSGNISGNISAEDVQLKSMSQTKAAMRCHKITVETGAVLEGKVLCLPTSALKSK
jgi:cytoskeletal protein CcmA (bactofilin family)